MFRQHVWMVLLLMAPALPLQAADGRTGIKPKRRSYPLEANPLGHTFLFAISFSIAFKPTSFPRRINSGGQPMPPSTSMIFDSAFSPSNIPNS